MSISETRPAVPLAPRRRRIVDAFIALLVLIFALDTMPCTPVSVRKLMEPLLDSTGLWQGTWSLFAPIPDSTNHRLRADFYYADGTRRAWNSPDWKSQTPWQRFAGHRHSEFIENIWTNENSAAWPGFAEFLARRESALMGTSARPDKVVLTVIYRDIPAPEGDSWPMASAAATPEQERVFFTLIFSEAL